MKIKSGTESSIKYTPETQKRNKQTASDKAREHKSAELSFQNNKNKGYSF